MAVRGEKLKRGTSVPCVIAPAGVGRASTVVRHFGWEPTYNDASYPRLPIERLASPHSPGDRMRRLLALLVIGMLVVPPVLDAQAVHPGSRVRIRHPGAGPRTGTLVALAADTLVVRWTDAADSARIPVSQVSRLDVSRGSQRRIMSRMGGGLAIGAAAGAVIGLALGVAEDCEAELFCITPAGGALVGGVLFGATGAVVGALTGIRPSERWERVPLEPGRVAVLVPTRGHGVLGIAIAF